MKTWGKIAFAAVLVFWALGTPWGVWAQVTAGFSQVGSVPFGTNTFTDNTVVSGNVYQYEVLSQNAAAISTPSNVVTTPLIPSGTHSATLKWTAPAAGGTPTQYLIERMSLSPSSCK